MIGHGFCAKAYTETIGMHTLVSENDGVDVFLTLTSSIGSRTVFLVNFPQQHSFFAPTRLTLC